MSLDQQSPLALQLRQQPSIDHRPKKLLLGVLFSFYLALSLARFVWPAQLLMSFILSTTGLLSLVLLSMTIQKRYLKIYSFIGLLIFSFVVSSLFVSRTERLGHVVLFILANTGVAMILVKGCVSREGVYVIFYSLSVCFVVMIVAGVGARDALTATSYNGISMMMLAACISLYIVLGVDGGKIDLKPALLTALICTWAIGRSGIMSSMFLLTGLFLINLKTRIKNWPAYFFILTLLVAFGIYLFFENLSALSEDGSILKNAVDNYSVRNAEESSPRLSMWLNYLRNLDLFRIIFGANIFTDPWPEGPDFGYNYHNSFINLHSQTGFMGLVVFALMALSLFKFWKSNRFFFVLFSTVIIRWSTDSGIFFESWDFLFYFFIFYYLCAKAGGAHIDRDEERENALANAAK